MSASTTHPVILFDGVCNLCNAAVNFIIDHDPEAVFRFAALQSEEGRRLIEGTALPRPLPDSIVLVDADGAWVESDAGLRIARRLRYPWRAAWAGRLVPRWLRDPVYRLIARNRYRLFGKTEACRIPTPELRSRFLSA